MANQSLFHEYMSRYNEHHQNLTNVLMHCVAVPLIYASVLGLLWALFSYLAMPFNLTWCVVAAVMFYYLTLSAVHAAIMIVFSGLVMAVIIWLESQQYSLISVSMWTFFSMWVVQFIGHKIEGKKPSFFEDLRFLLIGPLWWADHFVKRFR